MRPQSLHTHTVFCDGTGTPAQMAEAAFRAGCSAIGFSGHAPLAEQSWTMREEEIAAYRSQVLEQRRRWAGKMDVYLGLEQDFFFSADCRRMGLPYRVGAWSAGRRGIALGG